MEISKITNIINQINEIHVLKDINVTNGIFTSLDSRSSVHYVLFPLLNILGYNVFNPSEVKVNDGKDITIYEGDKKLIKINLVDLNKINDVEAFKKDFQNRSFSFSWYYCGNLCIFVCPVFKGWFLTLVF